MGIDKSRCFYNSDNLLPFLNNLNDLLIVTDLQGHIIHASRSLCNMLDYRLEEIKSLSFLNIITGKNSSDDKNIFSSFIHGKKELGVFDLLKKDGGQVPVETAMWSGNWEGGDCYFILMKDLSRENEAIQKFTKLFNANPALMAIVSLPELVYIDANQAFLNKLGYAWKEIIGKSGIDLNIFNENDRSEAAFLLRKNEKVKEQSVKLNCRNGEILEGLFSAEIIEARGERYLLMVIVDVTDIHKKEQELEQFFMVSLDLLCIADFAGNFIKVNKEWEYTLGYSVAELQKSMFLDYVHPDDMQKTLDTMKKLEGKEKILNFVNRYRKNDGSYRYIEWRSQPLGGYIYAAARDITERINYEAELEKREDRLKSIIEGTNVGTWEWNVQTGEVIFNERWAEIIGYTLEELKPVTIETWIKYAHPDDLEKSDELLKKHFKGESTHYEMEARMKHKNGSYVWVLDRGKVIKRDSEGKPLMMFGTHADITEKKQLEEKLQEIAISDPLTGIYNRRYFMSRVNEAYDYYKRDKISFSIAMIDIDFFKNLNDTYGHPAGDKILVEFTMILSDNIRSYDLLARYGGEEFVVLFIGLNKTESERKMNNVLEIVRNSVFDYEKNKIKFTFSSGIADASEECVNEKPVDCLIKKADQRLYAAKRSGRNMIVIDY